MRKPQADHLADEEIQQLLDGRSTADETQSARAHMAVCPACSRQYAQYALLDVSLRAAIPMTLSESVVRSVAAQVKTDRYLRALTRIAAVVGPLLAVLFLATLALTMYYLFGNTGVNALSSSRTATLGEWANTSLHQVEQVLVRAGDAANNFFRLSGTSTLVMIVFSIAVAFFIDGALTRRRKPPARV